MFEDVQVKHKKWGNGKIVSASDSHLIVAFGEKEIKFQFPAALGVFIETDDKDLLKYADECARNSKREAEERKAKEKETVHSFSYSGESDYTSPLLGRRAQDIVFTNKEDFFEALGYLANPGRIVFYQAEIPSDKVDTFEKHFPGHEYSIIAESYGKGGLITKQGCQFRINLSNLNNCPPLLEKHININEKSYAGRINRSKFALRLVQYYGFRFGHNQDLGLIKSKIPDQYMSCFEKGLAL